MSSKEGRKKVTQTKRAIGGMRSKASIQSNNNKEVKQLDWEKKETTLN